MTYQNASYALIQFVPTPRREESVNVGIAVAFPESGALRWKIDPKAIDRAKKDFFADRPHVGRKLEFQIRAVEAQLSRLAHAGSVQGLDVVQLGERLANEIRFSSLHATKVDAGPDETTDRLFDDLVLRPKGPSQKRTKVHHLFLEIARDFGVDDYVQRDVEAELPMLGGKHAVKFHFSYKNGCTNLVRAERFDVPGSESVLRGAAFARSLASAAQGQRSRLVLFAAADSADVFATLREALAGTNAGVYSASEPRPLFDEIREAKAAHGATE